MYILFRISALSRMTGPDAGMPPSLPDDIHLGIMHVFIFPFLNFSIDIGWI